MAQNANCENEISVIPASVAMLVSYTCHIHVTFTSFVRMFTSCFNNVTCM